MEDTMFAVKLSDTLRLQRHVRPMIDRAIIPSFDIGTRDVADREITFVAVAILESSESVESPNPRARSGMSLPHAESFGCNISISANISVGTDTEHHQRPGGINEPRLSHKYSLDVW